MTFHSNTPTFKHMNEIQKRSHDPMATNTSFGPSALLRAQRSLSHAVFYLHFLVPFTQMRSLWLREAK